MLKRQKHYFLGGNTSKGFYSLYRYILSQDEARRIICIKGGPGTGKSSLMKKVGNLFFEKGYNVEYHHCSSDSNSLDGVVIKELNIALLDATSPHVVDPINPGAVDEILNMGECWEEDKFADSRELIMDTNKNIGKTFKRAYRFLAAAKDIYEDWYTFNNDALNMSKINVFKEELKDTIFKKDVCKLGYDRHLFATAFTPAGVISFITNLIEDYENIYILKGPPGTGKTDVLQYLYEEGVRRGYYVEVLHTPLMPDKIEHVLIPELNTAIITSNEINKLTFDGRIFDMSSFLNSSSIEKNKDEIEQVKNTFYILLNKALSCIKNAKTLHDELEKLYIPNMDFEKVNAVTNEVINKLLKYEEEYLKENNTK
ncbi:MAG: PRK06851 family protein [Clostridium argentinense]|uniref:ATPase n=1 Tax=Clostridium faecium TaxID=2762223 RepID=A0ABR8YW66_9CLOT|nr:MULTISPECIES: PRK06851 family protein [Clostridium]MBD8048480.1 ATPase [Clostridium faecium]MBS5824675.1 PRK06851 family protein [Clostridium argentinense]MDU1349313.1 PRK06851 family protein [Clostridium argentinense]